jgi:uncharacterized protein YgiB involved in biofilm formation
VSASTKVRASAQVERPERFGFDLAVPDELATFIARERKGLRDLHYRAGIETLPVTHGGKVKRAPSAPGAGLRLKLSKRGGLAPIAWILFASSVSNVTGQTQPGQITYTTQTICENAKLLSLQDCKNAFVNANAELDEKAPRFSNRSECEHYFRYCIIGDIRGDSVHGKAKPRVSFIPALRAIVISGHSRGDRRVLPLVEGGKGGSLFQSRAVAETDSMESGEKTRRAQAAWAQQQAAAPAAANMASDPVYAPSEVDVEPKGGDPRCAALVNPFAYNACLARAGPKSKL